MMLVTTTEWYGLGALLAMVLLAVWRGDGLARRVAVVFALAWVGSVMVDDDGVRGVQWAIFAIDVLLAGWLVTETLLSGRIWLYVATAAQLMIVMTHVAFYLDARIVQEGFFSAYYVWSYVELLAIAAGALTARRKPR